MEALIDFAAVSAAIVFSVGVALSLEWFALNTLMKMMPVQQQAMAVEEITPGKQSGGPALVPPSFPGHKRAA